jgi:hypothetical protein
MISILIYWQLPSPPSAARASPLQQDGTESLIPEGQAWPADGLKQF